MSLFQFMSGAHGISCEYRYGEECGKGVEMGGINSLDTSMHLITHTLSENEYIPPTAKP